jgi:hypothetical protein
VRVRARVCVRARVFVHFSILLQDIVPQVKPFYENECVGHAVDFTCPLRVLNLSVSTAVSAILQTPYMKIKRKSTLCPETLHGFILD